MDPELSKDLTRKKRKVVQLPETEKADHKQHEEDAANDDLSLFCNETMEDCEAEDIDQQQETADFQEGQMSAEMEAGIQEIRLKISQFTDQVSKLLENVKTFFIETSTAFEERLVVLHRSQVEKWEDEIKLLGIIDAENEEMSFRLSNAQEFLQSMQ